MKINFDGVVPLPLSEKNNRYLITPVCVKISGRYSCRKHKFNDGNRCVIADIVKDEMHQ